MKRKTSEGQIKESQKAKTGPDPNRLKLEGSWEEVVKKALKRKRPSKERKGVRTMKTKPWHSIKKTDKPVYHDNTLCTEGNNIEAKNRKQGTDGRPKCDHCKRL